MKTEGYACYQVVDCKPGTQIENAKCSSFRGAHGRALARLVTATDDRIRVCCKPQLEPVYPTPPNLPISDNNSATVIRISLGVGVIDTGPPGIIDVSMYIVQNPLEVGCGVIIHNPTRCRGKIKSFRPPGTPLTMSQL